MARIYSRGLSKGPNAMRAMGAGDGVSADETLVLSAAPTANDVLELLFVPAGTRLQTLEIRNTDMDAGTAFAAKVGYASVDGGESDDDYFAAAGAFCQSAGVTRFNFAPITFQRDTWVIATVTTAPGTFAAGSVITVGQGRSLGVK